MKLLELVKIWPGAATPHDAAMAEFATDFSQRFNPDSDFYLDIEQVTMHQRIGGGEFSDVYLGSYFGDKARDWRAMPPQRGARHARPPPPRTSRLRSR